MGKNSAHVPVRTCVSCRKRREKPDLIKLVVDDHSFLIRDGKVNRHGRGAYICRDKSCWESLKKRKSLGKLFRTENRIAFHPELRFEPEKTRETDI